MMTGVVMLFSALAAGFMQGLLPGPAWLGQARWPLLLGVVLYYALQRNTVTMLTAAVLAGFVQDALSAVPLGYSACAFVAVGWGAAHFRQLVLSEALVTQAFFGLTGSALANLLIYLLLRKDALVVLSAGQVVLKLAGTAMLGVVSTPLIFNLAGRLDRLAGNIDTAKDVEGTDGELDGFAE